MAFTPFVETDQPTMANFNAKFQEAIQAASDDAVDRAAKMQIVSYVGTGTYGVNNPCSITADFPIESATFLGYITSGRWFDAYMSSAEGSILTVISSLLSTNYSQYSGFASGSNSWSNTYGKKSSDGKTLSWYTTSSSAGSQLNHSGITYYFLCRG